MTEAERIARAHRAQSAIDEFLDPMFAELDAEYTARMVEVANSELSRDKRADKITALSNALKISRTLKAGMQEIIRDGEMANREKLRAEKLETMTPSARRLFGIAPH